MIDWKEAVAWTAGLSALLFVATLVLLPVVIIYVPRDYFARSGAPLGTLRESHPVLRWMLLIIKNAAGGLFVLAGLVMLLTPGQGLLSLVIGLSMMDVPGKRQFLRRIVGRPAVLRAINAVRQRAGKQPLEDPPEGDAATTSGDS